MLRKHKHDITACLIFIICSTLVIIYKENSESAVLMCAMFFMILISYFGHRYKARNLQLIETLRQNNINLDELESFLLNYYRPEEVNFINEKMQTIFKIIKDYRDGEYDNKDKNADGSENGSQIQEGSEEEKVVH